MRGITIQGGSEVITGQVDAKAERLDFPNGRPRIGGGTDEPKDSEGK